MTRSLPALLLAATCLGPAAPARADDRVMGPGHERAVRRLLADPGGDVAGWRLEGVTTGPGCEARARLDRGDGAAAIVVLAPPPGGAPGVAVRVEAPALPPADRAALAAALSARVEARADPGFFAARCATPAPPAAPPGGGAAPAADGRGSPEAAPAASPRPPPGRLAWALAALVVAAGAALALRRRAGRPPPAPGPPPDVVRRRRVAVGLLLVAALAVRAARLVAAGPDEVELYSLAAVAQLDRAWVGGDFSNRFYLYHPPLHGLLLLAWGRLGELFGAGGEVAWLRAPNLALLAAQLLLLVRLGERLGSWGAGLGAAVLAGFVPVLEALGISAANYAMEMVAATWFLERLAARVAQDRPVDASLALAAAAALWTGHMSLLVVAPGGALYLAVMLARGRRAEALLATLLLAALYAPVAWVLVEGARSYAAAHGAGAVARPPGAPLPSDLVPTGDPLGIAAGLLRVTLGARAGSLPGLAVAVAAALGWALALRRRPGPALLALAVLGAYLAAGTLVHLRVANYAAAVPLLHLAPLLGLGTLGRSGLAGAAQGALVLASLLSARAVPGLAHGDPVSGYAANEVHYAAGGEAVAAALRAEGAPGDPVLWTAPLLDAWAYAFFPDRASLDDVGAQVGARAPWPVPGFEARPLGGRLHVAPHEGPAPTCPAFDAALALPPWTAGPFWLVTPADAPDPLPPLATCSGPARHLPAACTPPRPAGGATVRRCAALPRP